MLNKKIFRLNPEIFLVPGKHRSVVHNLYTGDAMWCDEESTRLLSESESNRPVPGDAEIFGMLKDKGWGCFYDSPPFIDKLRNYNVFREKRAWKETPYLSMAVLQLTDRCNLSCETCGTEFCPVCRSGHDNRTDVMLEPGEWIDIITELVGYGLKQVLLTGGEAFLYPGLQSILTAVKNLPVAVQIHTNGQLLPSFDCRNSAFSVKVSSADQLLNAVNHFRNHPHVSLLVNDFDETPYKKDIPVSWHIFQVSSAPPVIQKNSLAQTDFNRFHLRRKDDECLLGKMYITSNGGIIPCFGSREAPLGNIVREGAARIIKILVDNIWNVSVARAKRGRKCASCEFVHCCVSCKFLNETEQCHYNIDNGCWD